MSLAEWTHRAFVWHAQGQIGFVLEVVSFDALNVALGEFRFWYNQVRPHQHLGGATPAEAWADMNSFTARIKNESWFEAWDGLLQGYYLRR